MTVRGLGVWSLLGLACFGVAAGQAAQTGVQAGGDGQTYTLHAETRVVLTDVTVTDAKGNPVHGLSRSAFHIFDNNKPQEVASFEEHSGGPGLVEVEEPGPANTFSNDFLLHPPAVFNVIMLDTVTIGIMDQMYLNEELTHFIEKLPAGEPLAIYVHAGDFSILLQNFTADHALLLRALHRAIPILHQMGTSEANDIRPLHEMAVYLGQLPGRKNVLWFSGSPRLCLHEGVPGEFCAPVPRAVFDELEAARIALYPIDVRGPIMTGMEHMLMEDEAEATGGHAYFNINWLAETTEKILATDTSFYTLTYSPRNLAIDNKWHKVKVKVDGGIYQLSYRQGYFADGANLTGKSSRTALKAGGKTVQLPEQRSEPIIFQASVQPMDMGGVTRVDVSTANVAPAKKGETAYTIHYSVPASSFSQESVGQEQKVEIGAGILAVNHLGRTVSRVSDKFTLMLNAEKLRTSPNASLNFDQRVNLPTGEDYLNVVLWDMTSGRMGTIQVPLDVAKK